MIQLKGKYEIFSYVGSSFSYFCPLTTFLIPQHIYNGFVNSVLMVEHSSTCLVMILIIPKFEIHFYGFTRLFYV